MESRKSSIAQLEEGNSSVASTLDDNPVDHKESITNEEPYTVFTTFQQIRFLTICALTGMISPLTASIYMPALIQIQEVS